MASEQLGDAPIEPGFVRQMNDIARAIDMAFNGSDSERSIGFVLLMFPYGSDEGRCNYISNGADRKDIVKLFKEQIKRFEGLENE
jgi:hypothetical protein